MSEREEKKERERDGEKTVLLLLSLFFSPSSFPHFAASLRCGF